MTKTDTGLLQKWLDAWGYSDSPASLHFNVSSIPATHPYRNELSDLLDPQGSIRAKAIFDVEGTPTVCFIENDGSMASDSSVLHAIREQVWNQNLVSIVLVVDTATAIAAPSAVPCAKLQQVSYSDAQSLGQFSRADIQSGEVFFRHPSWFRPENRVDRKLLSNLALVVTALHAEGMDKVAAQLLMA